MNYIIKNEQLILTVSSHGAEIKSINYQNQERMHDSNPLYWNRTAPLLFPCIGTITNNQTSINGKMYSLTKHGFLRDQDFDLVKQDSKSLVFRFKSNKVTYQIYPFNFEVIVSYHIFENEVLSKVTIKNKSTENMPFNFGLHPAFKTPINADEKFEDYQLLIQSRKNHPVLPVDLTNGTIDFINHGRVINFKQPLNLNYDDYAGDALVFDNIDFNKITLQNKKATHGVTFTFKNFPMLGIWTPYPKQAPFICLEPWIGCADSTTHDGLFFHKKYLKWLCPKEHTTISYSFKFF